jgi:CheY-like chemotaxis protein
MIWSDTGRRRVFVVEDETLIRMLLEDMLADLGYAVTAAAGRLGEALELAKTGDFDLAILDVNLDGVPVFPVADVLAARGIPFIFATGYGSQSLNGVYCSYPTLQKPFQLEGLQRALASLNTPVANA